MAALAPFIPMAIYAVADLLNRTVQQSNQQSQENARLREDLERFHDRQQMMMMNFAIVLSRIREKHIKTFHELQDRDSEAKELLVELAQKAIPIQMNGNNIAFFGLTSTGKSTLLNSLLGEKVAKTGVGETTIEITPYTGAKFILWDVPGRNDEMVYLSLKYISFFKGLTRRLILITSTVKENSSIMQLLDEINLEYDIIVNKFDLIDENERQEHKDQIQSEIERLKLKKVNKIFYISAKNPPMFDWMELVSYLTD